MAIRDTIDANITTNGVNAITGAVMRTTLKAMVTDYEADVADEATVRGAADTALQTAVAGKYTKPSGGIPKTDLASGVQTSLGKADTALQSVPNTYRTAAAQDVIDNGKQATLVSGTNIKTINGQSVLGSGNLDVGSDIEVKQTTGQSTTAVMSQKAVTDELDGKADTFGAYEGLVAGTALNLAGGAKVETPFTFRATAGSGVSVGNGTALFKALGGKSMVWNQLVQNGDFSSGTTGWIGQGCTLSIEDNALKAEITSVSSAMLSKSLKKIVGHIYLVSIEFKCNRAVQISCASLTNWTYPRFSYTTPNSWAKFTEVLTETGGGWNNYFNLYFGNDVFSPKVEAGDVCCVRNIQLFDLTQQALGITTAADFKALFPNSYYPYNAGQVVHFNPTGIMTAGFNQLKLATGKVNALPMQYQITGTYTAITQNGATITPDANGLFTPSAGELTITGGNDTTCVHLVHSGSRNGEYEAYWEHTMPLNIANIKSNNVAIFPNGMKSAGTAKDYFIIDNDGYARKAVKCIGEVDLGTLNWSYAAEYNIFLCDNAVPQAEVDASFICSIYTDASPYYNNCGFVFETNGNVRCRNTQYGSDAAAFKTAMNGVMLYYELAIPITYTLDTPIFMGYTEKDWGTEEIVVAANTQSTPVYGTIEYPLNAPDEIKNLPKNYVSIAATGSSTLATLLEALKTAQIISAYTITYNNGAYGFTLTKYTE